MNSGDVGIHVERAVGRRQPVDPDISQPVQQLPVGAVVPQVAVGLGDRLGVNAATAAYCASTGGQMVKLPVRQSIVRCSDLGTNSQPSRQPVIAKYFEKLLTTTASREVLQAQLVCGAPGYTRPW